jgi:hypothetical protein
MANKTNTTNFAIKNNWTLKELMKLPKSRGQALLENSRTFFNSSSCPQNHLSPRLTSSGKCQVCISLRGKKSRQVVQSSKDLISPKIHKTEWSIDELLNLPQDRTIALKAAEKFYFDGEACVNGHMAPRLSSCGQCKTCLYEINKRSREKNKSEAKALSDRYSDRDKGVGTSLAGLLWSTAKLRAKKIGRDFSIEISDIEIPDICPILGIQLDKSWGSVSQDNLSRANKVTIDRINSSAGYVKGNIQVISYRANVLKKDGTSLEHRLIAEYISKFKSKNN